MTKKFISVFLIIAAASFYQCKSPATDIEKTPESAVPAELKDSIAGKTDDNSSLEKLKNVVSDSSEKK